MPCKLIFHEFLTLRTLILIISYGVFQGFSIFHFLQIVSKTLCKIPNQPSAFVRWTCHYVRYTDLDAFCLLDSAHVYKSSHSCGLYTAPVTHLIGFAHQIADRVLFMNQGEIVESGTIDVLKNPKSSEGKKFLSLLRFENAIS